MCMFNSGQGILLRPGAIIPNSLYKKEDLYTSPIPTMAFYYTNALLQKIYALCVCNRISFPNINVKSTPSSRDKNVSASLLVLIEIVKYPEKEEDDDEIKQGVEIRR